jgi:hypothetical protein
MKKTQVNNHEPIELLGVIRFSVGEFPTRDAEDQARRLHGEFAHLCRFKPHTRGFSPIFGKSGIPDKKTLFRLGVALGDA